MKVKCPRGCGCDVAYQPKGAYVAFCARCLAFLLPGEFTKKQIVKLKQ